MRTGTSTWLQQKIFVNKHTTRSWIHQQDFDKHPTFRVTYTSMCTTALPNFPRFPRHFRLSHLHFHDAEAMDKIHKVALAIRDDCLYSNHQLLCNPQNPLSDSHFNAYNCTCLLWYHIDYQDIQPIPPQKHVV